MFLLPRHFHDYDMGLFKLWAIQNFKFGVGNAYKISNNYLPLYQYILYFFAFIQGNVANVEKNLYLLKGLTLVFDFAAGIYVVKIIKNKYKIEWLQNSFFYFFNILYLSNTMIWGQVDGILTCFVFISVFYAYKGENGLALLFLMLALNFKLQAIVFIPLIFILIIINIKKSFSFKNTILWLVIIFVTQYLILLPFIRSGQINTVVNIYKSSIGIYPSISMNAFNFWYLFFQGDLGDVPDTIRFINIDFKNWGLLIFCALSLITLLPLLKNAFGILFKK